MLSKVPEYFSNFKKLKYLKIEKNSIESIPSKVGNLPNLKYLKADVEAYSPDQKKKFYSPPYEIEYKF